MPLLSGSSSKTLAENIRKLREEGLPAKQAAAIAYDKQRESKKRKKKKEKK